MTQTPTQNRRSFLKTTGAALGALFIAGAGGLAWALTEPAHPIYRNTCLEEVSMKPVLIAYASKCGSTGEIAAKIAERLCQQGLAAETHPVQEVKDLSLYRAVVLGSALRFEKPLPEMSGFVKKNAAALRALPVALFSAGVYMRDDTPENREKTLGFLSELRADLPELTSLGLFGGKVDYNTISPFWRFLVSMDSSGLMREGDGRDWPAIQAWADDFAARLG